MSVTLTADDRRELSGLRWKWGFLGMIGWVLLWWAYLDAQHQTELAKRQNCDQVQGIFSTAGCEGSNLATTASATATKYGGLFLVLLSSPLGFIGGAYAARAKVESGRREALTREKGQAEAQTREEERARAARLAQAEDANKEARAKSAREEFILKLGSVSDTLKLLPDADANTAKLMTQAIEKELRELVAKHPLDALQALIQGDATIQFKLKAVGDKLANQRIDSDDARLMLSLLRGGSSA